MTEDVSIASCALWCDPARRGDLPPKFSFSPVMSLGDLKDHYRRQFGSHMSPNVSDSLEFLSPDGTAVSKLDGLKQLWVGPVRVALHFDDFHTDFWLSAAEVGESALREWLPSAFQAVFGLPGIFDSQTSPLTFLDGKSLTDSRLRRTLQDVSVRVHLDPLRLCEVRIGATKAPVFAAGALRRSPALNRVISLLLGSAFPCPGTRIELSDSECQVFTEKCVSPPLESFSGVFYAGPKFSPLYLAEKVGRAVKVQVELPVGVVTVLVDPKDPSRLRDFVEQYLHQKFGWRPLFEITGEKPSVVTLTNGTVVVGPNGVERRWFWRPETSFLQLTEDAAALHGLDPKEYTIAIPAHIISPPLHVLAQFPPGERAVLRLERIVPFGVTVIFDGSSISLSGLTRRNAMRALRAELVAELNRRDPSLGVEFADPVISISADGPAIPDDALLNDTPDVLYASLPSRFELPYEYEGDFFTIGLGREATVYTARVAIAERLSADPDQLIILYAGRELRDDLLVARLQVSPPDHVLVILIPSDSFLLESMGAFKGLPREFVFYLRAHGAITRECRLELFGTDTIDRARIGLAAQLKTNPESVSIWCKGTRLADCIVLGELGDAKLEFTVAAPQRPPSKVLVTSLMGIAGGTRSAPHPPPRTESILHQREEDDDEVESVSLEERTLIDDVRRCYGDLDAVDILSQSGYNQAAVMAALRERAIGEGGFSASRSFFSGQ